MLDCGSDLAVDEGYVVAGGTVRAAERHLLRRTLLDIALLWSDFSMVTFPLDQHFGFLIHHVLLLLLVDVRIGREIVVDGDRTDFREGATLRRPHLCPAGVRRAVHDGRLASAVGYRPGGVRGQLSTMALVAGNRLLAGALRALTREGPQEVREVFEGDLLQRVVRHGLPLPGEQLEVKAEVRHAARLVFGDVLRANVHRGRVAKPPLLSDPWGDGRVARVVRG